MLDPNTCANAIANGNDVSSGYTVLNQIMHCNGANKYSERNDSTLGHDLDGERKTNNECEGEHNHLCPHAVVTTSERAKSDKRPRRARSRVTETSLIAQIRDNRNGNTKGFPQGSHSTEPITCCLAKAKHSVRCIPRRKASTCILCICVNPLAASNRAVRKILIKQVFLTLPKCFLDTCKYEKPK